LVIVGRGPDGLIAAIYAREEISASVVACAAWGALLQQTSEVRNLSVFLVPR
jgi:thioredoxin reductase